LTFGGKCICWFTLTLTREKWQNNMGPMVSPGINFIKLAKSEWQKAQSHQQIATSQAWQPAQISYENVL
jgi:hypothetical protein